MRPESATFVTLYSGPAPDSAYAMIVFDHNGPVGRRRRREGAGALSPHLQCVCGIRSRERHAAAYIIKG